MPENATDLDKQIRRLHEKCSITLRRHELQTLANFADSAAIRYLKKSERKNASAYTAESDVRTAGAYRKLATEIRAQINN